MRIIACDFDGTLCEHKYPAIGEPKKNIINLFIKMRRSGYKIILWTCRGGEYLDEAIKWCKKFGLEFDAVNDDLPEIKSFNKLPKSCKVYADFYFDDKNVTFDKLFNIYQAATYEGD